MMDRVDRSPTAGSDCTERTSIQEIAVIIEVSPLRRQVQIVLRGQLRSFRADIADSGHHRLSKLVLNIKTPALNVGRDGAVLVNGLWLLSGIELAAIGAERNRPRALLDGHRRREYITQVEIRYILISRIQRRVECDTSIPRRVPKHLIEEFEAPGFVEHPVPAANNLLVTHAVGEANPGGKIV